jgi:hypothetical protein
MSIPRCPHGLYNGTTDGDPSMYCTGCQVSKVGIVQQTEETQRLEAEWAKIVNTTN